MTKYFLQISFTILFLFLGFQCSFAQSLISAKEYVVYSDLLKQIWGDDEQSRFTISKNTRGDLIENSRRIRKLFPNEIDLIKNFNKRNELKVGIQNQFKLKSKIQFHSEEDFIDMFNSVNESNDEVAEKKYWEKFREKYQTFSILTLSRVGFNKNQNKALVELGATSGGLAGHGFYYLMVKIGNKWKVKKRVRAWVS